MPLSDADIEYYARQVIVPGIGATGQARLCAARVGLAGQGQGSKTAESYLRALGCTVVPAGAPADCTILAGADEVARDCVCESAGAGGPIVWYVASGGRVTAGVAMSASELPIFASMDGAATSTPGLLAVAACDSVATAAALILGWDDAERVYDVTLA